MYLGSQRIQQAFVTVTVALLGNPVQSKRIVNNQATLAKFIHLLESPSFILRGKV